MVFPNNVHPPRRYVVDDDTKELTPVDQQQDSIHQQRNIGGVASPILEEAYPGSASVSELSVGGSGKSYLLTTSAKLDEPHVLSIALTSNHYSHSPASLVESPVIVELDCSQLHLQTLVKVQAFAHAGSSHNGGASASSGATMVIQLTLVDSEGTFVTFFLSDHLLPVATSRANTTATTTSARVQVLRTIDYISDVTTLQTVSGSELHSTMVAFASSTAVVIALSPHLITVNLSSGTSHVWSEIQCLEDMRSRTSRFGSFLGNVMVLRRQDNENLEMASTAALCLSTTANPLLDNLYCLTLHSDATIRKWKLNLAQSPLPSEVIKLGSATTQVQLPPPSTWSAARNSVALSCRLYDQTYALAVHIRTTGLYSSPHQSPQFKMPGKKAAEKSDCQLCVFHGNVHEQDGSLVSKAILKVPKEATSLVSMTFTPTHTRCSLSVVFESSNIEHTPTLDLVYPPSNMSIVSTEPVRIRHGSLDSVAMTERSRIRALLIGPIILAEMEDATVDQLLHELDTRYMKFLFRPLFLRGTGTVHPPSASCIRRALAKLVAHNTATTSKEHGRSIELETVRTLHEWRLRDNQKMAAAARADATKKLAVPPESPMKDTADGGLDVTTPFSVYDALVQDCLDQEEQDGDDAMDINFDPSVHEEKMMKLEQMRSAQVEAHERRWSKLLLQVWEEERTHRVPLATEWLSTQPSHIIVRMGITTIVNNMAPATHVPNSSDWQASFDGIALKLLQRIENNPDQSSRLYAVEHQVTNEVARAELAVAPLGQGFIQELAALARWAWATDEGDGISDEEQDELEQAAYGLSPSQLVDWIQATPRNLSGALPGLEVMESTVELRDNDNVTWALKRVANYQVRHSACSLSLQCVDSVRRLQLSRCLLLLDMIEGSEARDAALRAYFHSIAVLWTSSQRIPVPMTMFQSQPPMRLGQSSPEAPPSKRLSFGDDTTSILAPLSSTMTTSLDAVIIEISQTMDEACSVPPSLVGVSIFLAQSFFRRAFAARSDIPIDKPSLLPELGCLPRPRDPSIATDHPRLALRLLAPFVACSLPEDLADVVVARKESLAECLLIESHSNSASGPRKRQMRQIACELLVPKGPSHDNAVDQRMIRKAFDALGALRRSAPGVTASKEDLAKTIQLMVQTAATSIESLRMCELETVKNLFGPVAAGAARNMDGVTRASITLLAGIMLHFSRVMYRLTILERHTSVHIGEDDEEQPAVLLGFISSAIAEMSKTFPDDVWQSMPEYGKMWSRLFHHAVLSRQWDTAYNACIRSPKSELREGSFKRLVRAMVDQGALNELLVLCTNLGIRVSRMSTNADTGTDETVDLYEIAADILAADAGPRDLYVLRAASPQPAGLSDFQGALYALHASQKNWRRAAQAMDLRFLNAQKALGSKTQEYAFNPQAAELRDGLIVDDLVLASLGAFNAIELVSDEAHKFLVCGEYGPYTPIPVEETDVERSNFSSAKRTRGEPASPQDVAETDDSDRLSKFMTKVALEGRAIRSMALRTLYFDRSSDPVFVKSAFLQDVDSSTNVIEELFSAGYFQDGLVLSEAWAKNCKADTGSRRPEGSDLFYDTLYHLLETHIIPKASNSAMSAPRPTLNQVQYSLDSTNGIPSYVVVEKCGKMADISNVALRAATMSLVRKLCLTYSTAETPVALDVASLLLDNGTLQLPSWLERLLLASDVAPPNGLFAPRLKNGGKVYSGNPAALLALYMKRGLLTEACNVVSKTLSSVDKDGKTLDEKAPSRLPEKGDIDFIPYKQIDQLCNLIDVVLGKGVLGPTDAEGIKSARANMETSLERHFARLKISESGQRSARALLK